MEELGDEFILVFVKHIATFDVGQLRVFFHYPIEAEQRGIGLYGTWLDNTLPGDPGLVEVPVAQVD